MSELKPCPFCGGEAITTAFFDADDFDYMPIEVNDCDAEVTCKNERCINGWWLSPKDWNTRPIEDALNARIAELEAAQRWIRTKVKLPDRAVRQFYEVVCLHQDFAELALFSKGRWIIYEGTSVYDITDRVVFWRRRQPLPAEVMDVLNKRQELQ